MNEYTENATLHEGYQRWLAAPHPRFEGVTNAGRKPNDLKNHERALACYIAAVGDGEQDPTRLPLSVLQRNDTLLARHVREGARILAARRGKELPSDKTLSNLVSCLKGIQKVACRDLPQGQSIRERLKARPKRTQRPGFLKSRWPETLKEQWDAWKVWKTADFLPMAEAKYRKSKSRESSFKSYLRKLNPYVGFLVQQQGRADVTLVDLCTVDNYLAFLNWYLSLDADGGFYGAKEAGVTLAVLSQYLVATGQLDETTQDGTKIWNVFYAKANEAIKVGADRGQLTVEKDVGDWKPWHLAELAEAIWESSPVHKGTPHGQRHKRQLVCRKRTALFYRLAMETPLRIRNWANMRWGKNLYQEKDGRWTVYFIGDELKVGRRGYESNVYKRTYSAEASAWIDRWRQLLESWLGPDFETRCPYVLPSADLGPHGCTESTLAGQIDGLCEETLGKHFHPHLVRHIVASHIVNEQGAGGIKLAAQLLGDTEAVVLKTYYRPNTDEAMQAYLATCTAKKGNGRT